jgi:hypothetical protein
MSYLGDLANQEASRTAALNAEEQAAADLADLYRRQAAAAAGAGRAAAAASDAASARGRIQEQAQAAAVQAASNEAAMRIYTRPNYLRIGLVFGGLGLGVYLLARRKPKFGGHR